MESRRQQVHRHVGWQRSLFRCAGTWTLRTVGNFPDGMADVCCIAHTDSGNACARVSSCGGCSAECCAAALRHERPDSARQPFAFAQRMRQGDQPPATVSGAWAEGHPGTSDAATRARQRQERPPVQLRKPLGRSAHSPAVGMRVQTQAERAHDRQRGLSRTPSRCSCSQSRSRTKAEHLSVGSRPPEHRKCLASATNCIPVPERWMAGMLGAACCHQRRTARSLVAGAAMSTRSPTAAGPC